MKANKILNVIAFGMILSVVSSCGGNISSTTSNTTSTDSTSTSTTNSQSSMFPDVESASFSLNYNNISSIKNCAEGLLLISKKSEFNSKISYLNIAWGNQNGVLDDYNTLKQINQLTASDFEYEFKNNSLIPTEANKIRVEAYDKNNVLIENASTDLTDFKKQEDKLYEFQVISDQQVNSNNGCFYRRSKKTFEDIKENSPSSKVIVINGDVVDEATSANYDSFFDSYKSVFTDGKQKMTLGIGNHEFIKHDESNEFIASRTKEQLQSMYKERLDLWKNKTNNKDLYFYEEINGSYFIYLGTTAYPETLDGNTKASCMLGETQLKWLSNVLLEANKTKKPIFLFSHGSLRDTVSGSLRSLNQTWYGYSEEEEIKLREIIKLYPQILFFSAHSHWSFENENPYLITNNYPSFFNTAAIGYLWEGNGSGNIYNHGSYENGGAQGLYLEVYKDQIMIKGRQFEASDKVSKYWHSAYQVVLPY
ncbi:MAG: hypothetical protein RR734_03295 [Bacilli bacterium]